MPKIPENYLERVYAGWLAKMIGIRLGAAVEGWEYARIKELFGELTYYPAEYKNFAADDDSNGPLYFLRALEEKRGEEMTAQDVGEALLNYAPYEHSFFWWGGYGVSTEHTAYLNLRRGIKAPKSGSIEVNGVAIAEQIGGQIFIDTWGLVAPGNPDMAAKLAEKAASVTHDGNGIYGGVYVACAISIAFIERDVRKVMERALNYIPMDCEYQRVVRAVMGFHDNNPRSNWEDAYHYVREHFGYDKYPGVCHIIPNSAVMALSMLYGKGDFDNTINICNMCGWDTDCNVGNVATIMGVLCGIDAIDTQKWIRPINDLCIRSGVLGDMNNVDIPYGASYIARLAYQLAGEEMPDGWSAWLTDRIYDCHFEYPKSTHALNIRSEGPSNTAHLINTNEAAYTGKRCLKFFATRLKPEQELFVYRKTYYWKEDFSDSRYDPSFSPIFYPGQTVKAAICVPDFGNETWGCAYVRDTRADKTYYGQRVYLKRGEWNQVEVQAPSLEGGLIDEAGVCFVTPEEKVKKGYQLVAYIDDLSFSGLPDYTLDFNREKIQVWSERHTDITQLSRMKGQSDLQNGSLRIACEDEGEWYTGSHQWQDYHAEYTFKPVCGSEFMALFRVQGAMRSYAAGLIGDTLCIQKNVNGYVTLAQVPFKLQMGETISLKVGLRGNHMTVSCSGTVLAYTDEDRPYLNGCVGMAVRNHSIAIVDKIRIKGE